MSFRIRRATKADSQGVVRVVKAVFEEYGFTWEAEGYHADLYDLEGHYNALGHRFFVAVSDGTGAEEEIVGTIALRLFDPILGAPGTPVELNGRTRIAGCDCSLDRLYVLPQARKMGVGSALAQRVVEEAALAGCSRMEIWSDKRFVDAHRLYGRLGARQVSDRVLDDPDQSPEWGLEVGL